MIGAGESPPYVFPKPNENVSAHSYININNFMPPPRRLTCSEGEPSKRKPKELGLEW
jgi:hypothetical protein